MKKGRKVNENHLMVYVKNLFLIALIFLVGRAVSALVVSKIYGLTYEIEKIGEILPVLSYNSENVQVFKNMSSISLLVPGLILFLIFMWVSFKKYKTIELKRVHMNSWLLGIMLVVIQWLLVISINDLIQFENSWYGLLTSVGLFLVAVVVYVRKFN